MILNQLGNLFTPRPGLILCFLLLLFGTFFACKNESPAVVGKRKVKISGELSKLDSLELSALFYGDTLVLKDLLLDEFTFISDRGELLDKSDLILKFQKKPIHPDSTLIFVEESRTEIFEHGKIALQTGIQVKETLHKKGILILRNRYTNVYYKVHNTWKLASSQQTRIK
jgi:hypothetical protein